MALAWILIGAIVASFIAAGIYILVRKTHDFKVYGIKFLFDDAATWARTDFNEQTIKACINGMLLFKGWTQHVSLLNGMKVLMTGEFPIVYGGGECYGYYIEDGRRAVIGINRYDMISPKTGRKYRAMLKPEDTALNHEIRHHLRLRLLGDCDPDHQDKDWWKN